MKTFIIAIMLQALSAWGHDHPSVHGMLVLGEDKIFLSHLPMYHSPHDYQAILEVSVPANVKSAYLASKEAHSEKVYTLVPESFVLPDMIAKPRPFKAKLFRGHFERGGEAITGDITVTIKNVVYFTKLNANQPRPAVSQYLSFGSGQEWFLAHVITDRPSFDQIVQLDYPGAVGVLTLSGTRETTPLMPNHLYVIPALGNSVLVKEDVYVERGDLAH